MTNAKVKKIKKGLAFFKENFERILDDNFPKGISKERGAALMMFVEIMMFLKLVLNDSLNPINDSSFLSDKNK